MANSGGSVLIVGAQVFDGLRSLGKRDVLVRGGLIIAIAKRIKPPFGVEQIDGSGMTLLPGLIDAHIHDIPGGAADALRFGVTSEFDMYGFADRAAAKARKAQRTDLGRVAQADVWSAGFGATPPGGHPTELFKDLPADVPQPPTLGPDQDVTAFMKARLAEGSDYIKIIEDDGGRPGNAPFLSAFSPFRLAQVMAAAKASGKLVIVHVQQLAAARQVVAEGADALAHALCDDAGDDTFFKAMRDRHVRQIGTLAIYNGIGGGTAGKLMAAQPWIAPLLSPTQKTILSMTLPHPAPAQFDTALENVRRAHKAGIIILAGTDSPNPTTAFGLSLHVELAMLVLAGLTPAEALAAATSAPAKFFGANDRGRISRGKRADLLLVEGDPLHDIAQSTHIAAIWKNGWKVQRTLSPQS